MKFFDQRLLHLTLLVFLFLISISSCRRENQQPVLAEIGRSRLTAAEFASRFNFNPSYNEDLPLDVQKRAVLASILAEKLFSETADHQTLPENVRIARDQTRREAVIEEMRLDSVERRIQISAEELQHEYKKSLTDILIDYLAFDDSVQASRFYNRCVVAGTDFKTAAREYLNQAGLAQEPIPQRQIFWGNESFALEEKVYQMAVGQISTPFFMTGQFYVIRIAAQFPGTAVSPENFESRQAALEERLFRVKAEAGYRDFYQRSIRPRLGAIRWATLRPVFNALQENTQFEQSASQSFEKPFSREIYLSSSERFKDILDLPVVRFPDSSLLDCRSVLRQLAFGPYVFDYRSEVAFKISFYRAVRLMVEHETIFRFASENGYEKNHRVELKTDGWNSYYLSVVERQAYLQSAGRDSAWSGLEEALLIKAGKFPIKINHQVWQAVELQPVGIMVKKTHFVNRLVEAPVNLFYGLPRWQEYVDSLLNAS